MDQAVILIPAYNEGSVIAQTITTALRACKNVVVVDDGSSDTTGAEIAKTKAQLVIHPINMGQGAALQTAVQYALQFPNYEYFVTFDADGQHDINDVKHMLKTLKKQNLDIVLGSRFLGTTEGMTKSKWLILQAAIKFTNTFSGVKLTDTHNGIRVFNRAFAEQLHITMPGMAHASEIIDTIGAGHWKYAEVPVHIIYTDYSRSKGQSMLNSVNIVIELVLKRLSR